LNTTLSLIQRLDAIGDALRHTGTALGLLGLGSSGLAHARMDAFSDLDFFALVQPGTKWRFLERLDWLAEAHPVAYAYRNTVDGYKALFADGIFCEFAVFEPDELASIPFAPGRVVWKADGFAESVLMPSHHDPHWAGEDTLEWRMGELLTNLYTGLSRHHRGEWRSAMWLIQGYALDHLIALMSANDDASSSDADPFDPQRRLEQRHPDIAAWLPRFAQGYPRNVESAREILAFVEARFQPHPAMAAAVRARLTNETNP